MLMHFTALPLTHQAALLTMPWSRAHLPPDVGLQLGQGGGAGGEHLGLQIGPEKDVTWVVVWRAGRPVSPPHWLPPHYPITKLPVPVDHVPVGHMAGGPILGPGQPIKIPPIVDPQLRQHPVLQQRVVDRASHCLVLVDLKPKDLTFARDASKDHHLGGVDRVVLGKVIWSASIHRIRCFERGVTPDILSVDMATEMKVGLI